jgi:electron transfer flavoprotein alpha subunit
VTGKPTRKLKVLPEKCIACGACEGVCPFDAIHLDGDSVVVDYEKCTSCGRCIGVCPTAALLLEGAAGKAADEVPEASPPTGPVDLPAPVADRDVWVYIEHGHGRAHPVSWELLGAGRRLAEKRGCALAAVVLGQDVGEFIRQAGEYGADRVYAMDHPLLATYRTTPHAHACVTLIGKHRPEILLMGATTEGRDLASAVATLVGTGLTADCTGLDIEENTNFLLQTRPAFGGNVMATILTRHHRPQMATVRPRVMDALPPEAGRTPIVVMENFDLSPEAITVEVVRWTPDAESDKPNLGYAEVIVSGGRGLGNAQGFELLRELADAVGGTLGASRAAVDSGWISREHQVGQTGKTVRPRLYIACGISGAVQHRVGMQGADTIIAINSDPEAPIFQFADYGVVGDLYQIVPELTQVARARNLRAILAGETAAKGATA